MSFVELPSQPGTAIGTLEDGVFTRYVRGSVHRLRKSPPGPGWCIDQEFLDQYADQVHTIRVLDQEQNVQYEVSYRRFMNLSRPIDLGWGKQRCLNLRYWTASAGDGAGEVKDII